MFPNLAFTQTLAGWPVNPDNDEAVIVDGQVSVEMVPVLGTKDWVHLIHIVSLNPGRGAGTQALNKILALLDHHGINLIGRIMPTDSQGIDKDALRNWYHKHGCSPVERNNPDGLWVRPPGGVGQVMIPKLSKEVQDKLLSGFSDSDYHINRERNSFIAKIGLAAIVGVILSKTI